MPNVLVVDDDPLMRNTLARMLVRLGCAVQQAGDGVEAASMLVGPPPPDLVITDMEMPRADGFAVLAAGLQAGVPVVIITAHASLEKGVEAMKKGAANFLAKPFTSEAVATVLQETVGAVTAKPARREKSQRGLPLGTDEAFRTVLDLIERVADTTATILLTGESGTGKEVVARAIHNASRRHNAAFVPVNCGAIPETLLESELFGHVRGAFTRSPTAGRSSSTRSATCRCRCR
jgi:DNA-binding NtrC family response regulator